MPKRSLPPLPEWYPRGTALLRDPTLNKGTAFSDHERDVLGLVDNWLRHVQDVHKKHAATFAGISDTVHMSDRLCELNVIEQVQNVCQTTVVQDAWERGQELTVHAWIYRLLDGELRDLCATASSREQVDAAIQSACQRLRAI